MKRHSAANFVRQIHVVNGFVKLAAGQSLYVSYDTCKTINECVIIQLIPVTHVN